MIDQINLPTLERSDDYQIHFDNPNPNLIILLSIMGIPKTGLSIVVNF